MGLAQADKGGCRGPGAKSISTVPPSSVSQERKDDEEFWRGSRVVLAERACLMRTKIQPCRRQADEGGRAGARPMAACFF